MQWNIHCEEEDLSDDDDKGDMKEEEEGGDEEGRGHLRNRASFSRETAPVSPATIVWLLAERVFAPAARCYHHRRHRHPLVTHATPPGGHGALRLALSPHCTRTILPGLRISDETRRAALAGIAFSPAYILDPGTQCALEHAVETLNSAAPPSVLTFFDEGVAADGGSPPMVTEEEFRALVVARLLDICPRRPQERDHK